MHKYLFLPLGLITSSLLIACGGGGGGNPEGGGQTSSLSGKVIDGYIQGATVCLDLNQNNACDINEPSSTTDANGSYKILYSSDALIENIPVVVNVPAGAIDQSDGTISKPYTLAAPSSQAIVISPFTTLALYKIKFSPGMTYRQAAQAVADKLMAQGASFDPTTDFISVGNTAIQNAARATVAVLQSSGLNSSVTQASLDEFLNIAQAPAQYGYANPAATFKQVQAEVSKVLQDALTVSALPITGTSYTTTPTVMAADKSGNLYVVDGTRILKVDQTTGVATAFVTGLSAPTGITLDDQGNIYVTDQNAVLKITATGNTTTLAGASTAGLTDGTATAARFNAPNSLAMGTDGILYVADTGNDAIRMINPTTGGVTTLDLSAYNTAANTGADSPRAITANTSGIYFAGQSGIHHWDGTRITSYLFFLNGTPTITFVGGITSSANGDIYYTDSLRAKVFKLFENPIKAAAMSPFLTAQIAGNTTSGSADGSAKTATFAFPMTGLAVGSNGTVYVSDSGNRKIRSIH